MLGSVYVRYANNPRFIEARASEWNLYIDF